MIRPLHDQEVIDSVYANRDIRKRIEHDDWKPSYIALPTIGYLGAWDESRFCGFFMIREVSKLDIEIHACLLPEAVALSRVLGVEVLHLLFNASPIRRVSAPIISDLVSAQNYVRKLGFKQEGVLRDACSRNGALLDVVLFGMTRTDFGEQYEFHNQRGRQCSR